MEKNKKGHLGVLLGFVVLSVALLLGLLMFFNNYDSAKPLSNNDDENNTTNPIEEVKDDSPVVAINFSSSLDTVLNNIILKGDYQETFRYKGAKFSFNCTNFDNQSNTCIEGSALMDVGTAMIPLYTYKNEEENYYNHQEDFYIILSDDYIVLATAKSLEQMGVSKIYNREGKFLVEVKNLLFGYRHKGEDVSHTYSALSDDKKTYYYYTCDKGKVAIAKYDLVNLKDLGIDEFIEDGTCN